MESTELTRQTNTSTQPVYKDISIIIPTYNEANNIIKLLESIDYDDDLSNHKLKVVVVDDNSPDGTADLAKKYSEERKYSDHGINSITVVRRSEKRGLSSAILDGIAHASSEIIVVMDADFSHPLALIPRMVEQFIYSKDVDLVVASRYASGGRIRGWNLKRRLISLGATKIAQIGLGVKKVKDPMSGFFAVRRSVMNTIRFDAIGYKILLEILVKANLRSIVELPYTFIDRREGSSKLSNLTIIQYLQACRRLSLHKHRKMKDNDGIIADNIIEEEKSTVGRLAKKVGKFYLVGASGLLVNYSTSFLIGRQLLEMYYLHATALGIALSILSNFFLNKLWTFGDIDMNPRKVARQGFWFLMSSIISIGAQIGLIYLFVEKLNIDYLFSLGLAVIMASTANFLVIKKLAFKERLLA
jgi:dolichol-phosphate mannosyltransferase